MRKDAAGAVLNYGAELEFDRKGDFIVQLDHAGVAFAVNKSFQVDDQRLWVLAYDNSFRRDRNYR